MASRFAPWYGQPNREIKGRGGQVHVAALAGNVETVNFWDVDDMIPRYTDVH